MVSADERLAKVWVAYLEGNILARAILTQIKKKFFFDLL